MMTLTCDTLRSIAWIFFSLFSSRLYFCGVNWRFFLLRFFAYWKKKSRWIFWLVLICNSTCVNLYQCWCGNWQHCRRIWVHARDLLYLATPAAQRTQGERGFLASKYETTEPQLFDWQRRQLGQRADVGQPLRSTAVAVALVHVIDACCVGTTGANVLIWCMISVPVIALGRVTATPPPKVDIRLKKWGREAVVLKQSKWRWTWTGISTPFLKKLPLQSLWLKQRHWI